MVLAMNALSQVPSLEKINEDVGILLKQIYALEPFPESKNSCRDRKHHMAETKQQNPTSFG